MVEKRRRILVVDDEAYIRDILRRNLAQAGFEVEEAADGLEGLEKLQEKEVDLVILDLRMSPMDGFEFLKVVKRDKRYRMIPVIVMTGQGGELDELKALELGADDFLGKPVERARLLARVRAHLRVKAYVEELENIEDVLVFLAQVAEAKDHYTETHLKRVSSYSLAIGKALRLGEETLDQLRKGALLHDIGKVGVPDRVLQKPGRLTPEEYEEMKKHTIIGYEMCKPLRSLQGGALLVIRHHHERWDGKGYPDGLKGEEIPLLARIVSVVDAYDAMTTDRVYRKALPREAAFEEIRRNAGSQFDPKIAGLFLEIVEGESEGSVV